MESRPNTVNLAILAAFVIALFAAGAAIFYFGGGTQEFHEGRTPEALDPTVEEAVRDGPDPGQIARPPPGGEGG
jgi:hypothetical protein